MSGSKYRVPFSTGTPAQKGITVGRRICMRARRSGAQHTYSMAELKASTQVQSMPEQWRNQQQQPRLRGVSVEWSTASEYSVQFWQHSNSLVTAALCTGSHKSLLPAQACLSHKQSLRSQQTSGFSATTCIGSNSPMQCFCFCNPLLAQSKSESCNKASESFLGKF